ncbi:hypothetical protein MNB_SM-6-1156 [hydrothermal vent metagenome]|uniref:Uncharacterized protein n=1 Tax=hydrothermal vent metagenome TaxID=652676 RepID=A0A1W1BWM9_9ZZZZ
MELMIVVLIIGVVYTIAVSKIRSPERKKMTPSFKNLKSYLQSFSTERADIAFVCPKSSETCFIEIDGKKTAKVKSFFDDSVEIFRYDYFQGFLQKNSHDFFRFGIDKDGVTDQVAIRYKKNVYDYIDYFDAPKVYDSLSALRDAKEALVQKVQQ